MNTQLFIISLILGFSLLGLGQAFSVYATHLDSAVHEDQSFICKQNNQVGKHEDTQTGKLITCTLVNDDDVFTKQGLDTLYTQFKYDLDVFSSQYLYNID